MRNSAQAALEDEPKVNTIARFRFASEFYPAFECKVDTLSAVETKVESSVISTGICYHEFACVLNKGVGATR